MGQSKKENREKLARLRQAKQKHNTICVGHQYTQTNTIDVNKTNKQPISELVLVAQVDQYHSKGNNSNSILVIFVYLPLTTL
jgi:hypothetical protein